MRDRLVLGLRRLRLRFWLLAGAQRKALACAECITRDFPDDVHALATQAHVLAALQCLPEALQRQARVVSLAPRDAAAWFNLGYLAEASGELERAEQAFARAIELDERLDRAWYGLALTQMRCGRDEQARHALQRTTELQPMSPLGWYHLAHVQARLHQTQEARRIVEHLWGFEPRVARQLEQELAAVAGQG